MVKVPDQHVQRVTDVLERHNPIDIDERAAGYGIGMGGTSATPTTTAGMAATGATMRGATMGDATTGHATTGDATMGTPAPGLAGSGGMASGTAGSGGCTPGGASPPTPPRGGEGISLYDRKNT